MRIATSVLGILVCVLAIVASSTTGYARFLSERAVGETRLRYANEAVSLAPSDPEANLSRGLVMIASGEFAMAIDYLEKATALRPEDYNIWLRLGQCRDLTGDTIGAIEAFRQSIRLAPYYGQPRWQLGSSLLKIGSKEAAYTELTKASHSDPYLLSFVIDIVWSTSAGNPGEVLRVVQPQTDAQRIALAKFFVKERKMSEALELLRTTGSAADFERHQLIIQLIEANRFSDASDVWHTGTGVSDGALIVDGSFERRATSENTGFLWRFLHSSPGVTISLDPNNARTGKNSLRLDFNGTPDSDAQFVEQLVMLEKNSRYQLTFAARGDEVTSGALPLVSIREAGPNGQVFAMSENLPAGSSDWRSYVVEFTTNNQTEAAYIVVQRKKCEGGFCPIVGRVWFDDFSLSKLQ